MSDTTRVEVLRTNGSREEHHVGNHIVQEFARRMIGADLLDFVTLEDGRVMAVDDRGYESETVEVSPGHFQQQPRRALKPVNAEATRLYHEVCRPGTTHQIVGDVAIYMEDGLHG